MANHIWTLICARAVIDKESNALSLYDIMEEVTVHARYAGEDPPDIAQRPIPITAVVVSLIERSDPKKEESGKLSVSVLAPNGKELATGEVAYSMTGPHVRFRSITNLTGLPVSAGGRYRVEVFLEKGRGREKVADVPLQIVLDIAKRDATS